MGARRDESEEGRKFVSTTVIIFMPKLFDVHTHTQFAAFEADHSEVIERALRDDIWMINVGTERETSEAAIRTAKQYKTGVWATVGLHPTHTSESYHDAKESKIPSAAGEDVHKFGAREESLDYGLYKSLAEDEKVVAVGECGLDYFRLSEETKNRQKEVFERHIMLAREVQKPLMIHCRNAFSDLIDILRARSAKLNASAPGIIHFMTGSKEDAKELLEFGFSFSFGGVITFTRDYDEVIRYLPMERILLETDAPYVAPVPYRGKRNEPSYVAEVAKKMAELRGVSLEAIAQKTTANALQLFKIA